MLDRRICLFGGLCSVQLLTAVILGAHLVWFFPCSNLKNSLSAVLKCFCWYFRITFFIRLRYTNTSGTAYVYMVKNWFVIKTYKEVMRYLYKVIMNRGYEYLSMKSKLIKGTGSPRLAANLYSSSYHSLQTSMRLCENIIYM